MEEHETLGLDDITFNGMWGAGTPQRGWQLHGPEAYGYVVWNAIALGTLLAVANILAGVAVFLMRRRPVLTAAEEVEMEVLNPPLVHTRSEEEIRIACTVVAPLRSTQGEEEQHDGLDKQFLARDDDDDDGDVDGDVEGKGVPGVLERTDTSSARMSLDHVEGSYFACIGTDLGNRAALIFLGAIHALVWGVAIGFSLYFLIYGVLLDQLGLMFALCAMVFLSIMMPVVVLFTLSSWICLADIKQPYRKAWNSVSLIARLALPFLLATATVMLVTSLVAPPILCGACFPENPDHIDRSTWLTRTISGTESFECVEEKGICFVYLLSGLDMSTQIQVVFHTAFLVDDAVVHVGRSQAQWEQSAPAVTRKLDITQIDRYVTSVLLSGLVPDSVYRLQCSVNNNTISKALLFRTSPRYTNVSKEQELVRFGGGGDLGAHPHVRLIARDIARSSPLFVYLGGDIAYAEANPNCYQRWDRVLDILTSELVTPDGLTIQWIVAIGNHDAGGYYRMASSIPFFPHYFPYVELGTKGFLESFTPEAEYEISLRRHMYHAHYVPGALGIFVGDSNHVSPTSIQARTFQRILNRAEHVPHLISVSHISSYPLYRPLSAQLSRIQRNDLQPLFDSYNFSLVLEHHEHQYKRTHPLARVDPEHDVAVVKDGATVYVGAGGWGAELKEPNERWYGAASYWEDHFYVSATVYGGEMRCSAIGVNGSVLDVVSMAGREMKVSSV